MRVERVRFVGAQRARTHEQVAGDAVAVEDRLDRELLIASSFYFKIPRYLPLREIRRTSASISVGEVIIIFRFRRKFKFGVFLVIPPVCCKQSEERNQ